MVQEPLTVAASIAYVELTGTLHPDSLLPTYRLGADPKVLEWVTLEAYAADLFLYLQVAEGFALPQDTINQVRLEVARRVQLEKQRATN